MSTLYTDVYDVFLSKVTDYSFINLNQQGLLEDVLFKYLEFAVIEFEDNCRNSLEFDDVNKCFVDDLTRQEKDILATYMILNYLDTKILDVKNMEQIITDADFKIYSQANHLKEMMNLQKKVQSDASSKVTKYSFKLGLIELR